MFITTPKNSSLHKSSTNMKEPTVNTKDQQKNNKIASSKRYSNVSSLHKQGLNSTIEHCSSQMLNRNIKRSSTLRVEDNRKYQQHKNTQSHANIPSSNQKYKLQVDAKGQHKQNNFMSTKWEQRQVNAIQDSLNKKSMPIINVISNGGNTTAKSHITLESKWQKIIETYTMRDQLSKKYHFPSASQLRKKYPILPGVSFYKILIKNRVFQKQWRINFPQTIFLDADAKIVMVYTDPQSGILKKKFIQKQAKQKDKYREEVLKFKDDFMEELYKFNKIRLFRQLKIQNNPNAPLSIMKYTEDNSLQFETDVQSYRNFVERKLKPTRDSIMQRYIYSNNLKAMVFRLFYKRHTYGQKYSGPQFEGMRFQNEKSIFKQSGSSSFAETHKLTSTISLSQKRIGTIRNSKITNQKALQKFIFVAKQLHKMLQFTENVVIDKLYVDFIVDIFDKPWVINIKYCEVNPNSLIHVKVKQDHISNVSSCRLCGAIEKKQNLKNAVSVRMLCEFISHLKKRTKQEQLHKIDFIQSLNINSKQNKTSAVCKICYNVIIHELQLIKMQKQLAQICNITLQTPKEGFQSESNTLKFTNNIGQYKQWRLMLFFGDIKNLSHLNINNSHSMGFRSLNSNGNSYHSLMNNFRNGENKSGDTQFVLKYQLCPKISESFLCKKQSGSSSNLKVNQVKLHYFYSQNTYIEEFINNTEIIVSLYALEESLQQRNFKQNQSHNLGNLSSPEKYKKAGFEQSDKPAPNERLIASGSTHILSSFNLYKSSSLSLKSLMQNGQRQTATVLLFFKNKKYCELTLKVGLVYDGSYNVNNIPTKGQNNQKQSNFIKWNEVWFSRSLCNSNPLPKQWMQIFGSRYNYNNTTYNSTSSDNKEDQNYEKIIKKIIQNSDFQNQANYE